MTYSQLHTTIRQYVQNQSQCRLHSFHRIAHWERVLHNGRVLAEAAGANREMVELFVIFHDLCRWTESIDAGHGAHGAELADRLCGEYVSWAMLKFELLHHACSWHQDEDFHDDVTIATCWDANQLDLGRVGITPDPDLLNTELAKQLARERHLEQALTKLAATTQHQSR